MRVIAGTARGKNLQALPGEEITPQVQKLLQKSGKISLDVVQ